MNVTTAAELELMTPRQRHEHFQSCIVSNLDDVAPEFLDRVRQRLVGRMIDDQESERQ